MAAVKKAEMAGVQVQELPWLHGLCNVVADIANQ